MEEAPKKWVEKSAVQLLMVRDTTKGLERKTKLDTAV
jgi:hypothetical protein